MRLAACALIVRDGRVLLGCRDPTRAYYPGVWDLFGGHVRPGESPAMALRRELVEELGILARVGAAAMVVAEPDPDRHGPGAFHVFRIDRWRGEPALRGGEHTRMGWFTRDEAAALALADRALLGVFDRLLG